MNTLRDKLIKEIDHDIRRREKFELRDFMTTEYLSWGSIVLGALSPIMAAFQAPSGYVAIAGALAGLLVAVDKAFSFAKRSNWNAEYKLSLKRIRYQLEDPKCKAGEIADNLIKVHLDWNSKFPGSKAAAP